MAFFCISTSCNIWLLRRFGGTYNLHLQGDQSGSGGCWSGWASGSVSFRPSRRAVGVESRLLRSCDHFSMEDEVDSQLRSTNIAQPYIPIVTAAPRNTHTFLSFFQKSNFQKLFGPFPGAQGAFAHHFRIPLLPLHILKFFPTFRPLFSLPSSRSFHPSTSWSSQYLL